METEYASTEASTESVTRRLLPLHVATFMAGLGFWVPVEKLFESEIGFDAASIGIVAAAYAALVPFLEMPSGVLADRWSRRNVLVIGNAALALAALIGGLSTSVPTYAVSAAALGVYFAMRSGTLESIVYDTVLEVTGDSSCFEKYLGRVNATESGALVLSALTGAGLAALTSPRWTYFVTVPFVASSIVALRRFREPQLHRADDSLPLRRQLAATFRTIAVPGRMRHIITLMVLTSVMLQMVLEFGPLWMVALAAPAMLYGPHWAGLMSAFGLGGMLASRLPTTRGGLTKVGVAMVTFATALAVSHQPIVVIGAQVGLAILLVAAGVVLTGRLHDEIPSTLRAGVASGVGTVTWLTFLPFALTFGAVSNAVGVHRAGWMLVGAAAITAAFLVRDIAVPGDERQNLGVVGVRQAVCV